MLQPHSDKMIFVLYVLWEACSLLLWMVEMNFGGWNGVESRP